MLQQLRLIALFHQGLTTARPFGKGSQATQSVLERLGYIQIDTLSVIERAHHHTLWTRIPDYQADHLHQLVRERHAFEYWSHAASYLPMRDYRFTLPQMASIKRGESPYYSDVDAKYMRHASARIRSDGPLKARDFKSSASKNGKWWNWKPAKRALEKLFMQGDLMITRRDGMEKVYDLTERVLPAGTNTREPSLVEFSEYLLNTSLSAHGFTTLKQLTHLRTGHKLRKALNTVFQQRIEAG
ncbi:MAG: winged helix-turn-helix domain-containing protein, partial [Verrucomicrobia bacterium]|nr:winged helix-turn-helix domain-containing protein [Verrucomicrobiota bacterium]